MTIIYFMRHSEVLKSNNINNSDSLQLQNEKWVLTKNGEELAKLKSMEEEFKNFDLVFASKYVRTILTAKYFTNNKILIDERFDERKFGIDSFLKIPDNYYEMQFKDFDYKLLNGESLNEVKKREEEAMNDILASYKDKKILIVGHSTAFSALFSKWCHINYPDSYIFNNQAFFDGKWNYLETFKLVFENDKLIDMKNIK